MRTGRMQPCTLRRAAGKIPYVIPLGLNNKPLGALGYVRAAREILQQRADFDAVVVASGSGATHTWWIADGTAGFGCKDAGLRHSACAGTQRNNWRGCRWR
ncbi:MAG: 1-aminocyclopropane-1-carboxylate deaminase [Paracoccaceae bacterium]|jgi:1-aminocyclopropane-1-carboxylate deaminase/D-cysteine desulfhydrase-like pyridoxal-dependent ACC family enzyme